MKHADLLLSAHLCPGPVSTSHRRSQPFSRAYRSHAALLLNGCATGVCSSALARAQEDGGGVCCGDKPEQRIDEINPDSVFHADNAALFLSRFGVDVDLAEDAEECEPENAKSIRQSM